jgi:hypothetical protein
MSLEMDVKVETGSGAAEKSSEVPPPGMVDVALESDNEVEVEAQTPNLTFRQKIFQLFDDPHSGRWVRGAPVLLGESDMTALW